MLVIDNVHGWGDIVFLKSDPEQSERLVIGVTAYSTHIEYVLKCGVELSEHQAIEISDTKDYKKSNN